MSETEKDKKEAILKSIRADNPIDDMDAILKEKLGIGLSDCYTVLTSVLKERGHELVPDLNFIAPYNEYDNLLEEPEKIENFLTTEAAKDENWKIHLIYLKEDSSLLELIFCNKAVDEGDVLKGIIYVGLSGKIRHAFCQVR